MIYQQKQVTRSVFRAYDIRGIINQDLDENSYYTIGLGLACYLQKLNRQCIYLARDGRLTSFSLSVALKQGLLDSGIHVIDLGEVATPVMYFATHLAVSDCGLMVTGSHNPADYNGIKMLLAGKTLVQENIAELYELIRAGQRVYGQGEDQTFDILDQYMNRITSDIHLQRPMKVVVDCGNGVAGPVVPQVLSALGCEVIPLYCDVDGRFPNHHPDPTVETNLIDLKRAVAEFKADIGLAFDGDADRVGVITEQGEMIWPDRLMMFYAREVLQRNPGATIVYDVKCSSHLAKVIAAAGGVPKMCSTGHSIVKTVMRHEQAPLAGEMSGHLFFKDRWYGFDDALYSACRLLELLSASSLRVSEQFQTIPNSINTPEIKIPLSDEEKFVFMDRFLNSADFSTAEEIITLDGIRVEFAHGWGLLRVSNTTPCLTARFEAKDEKSLKEIQQVFKQQMNLINKHLAIPF